MRLLALALALAPLAARAGVPEVLDAHLLPGLDAFAAATAELAGAARDTCDPAALDAPYQAAWDAWGAIGDLRLGPTEAAAFSIAFWPDERGAAARALAGLIRAESPAGLDPAAYADQSVAARGLLALDLLLHEDAFRGEPGSYPCRLTGTVAADLAGQAAALRDAWGPAAEALRTAGAEGNAAYLTEAEAVRAVYTQILAGLEFTADHRLGDPMGSFDAPRPNRAEGWRSGRPLAEVAASAEALTAVARLLADAPLPRSEAALEAVRAAAAAVDDPSFQDLADPTARLKLEILQGRVRALKDAVEAEVGAPLGVEAGFNSADGD